MNTERDNQATKDREKPADDRRQYPGFDPCPPSGIKTPDNPRADEYIDILVRARNG